MNDENRLLPVDADTARPLQLDHQLCFALYVSSKEIIRRYKPLLDPLRLTYTGYITMIALWEKDNVSVKELGRRLTLDSGTLTPLLKKLEARGYVVRIRSDRDERNVLIRLTDAGRALREKARAIPEALFRQSHIDPARTVRLRCALRELNAYLLGS